jgi:AAA15 family ATPase/GTPase
MLVEFRFKNFRSFMDDNVFSMVASADKTALLNNTVETRNTAVPRILKVAGIYGANASGKSNVVKAMAMMQFMVAQSAIFHPNQGLPAQPFKLGKSKTDAPTEFEITFFEGDVRYQFGFASDSMRITSEWLIVYKTNKPQQWYSREFNKKKGAYEYKFGPHLLGPKTVWQHSTRPNSLFLSTAVQLNSEQLKPVFDWITKGLVVFTNFGLLPPQKTIEHIKQSGAESVRQFLSTADIAIEDIQLKSYPGFIQQIAVDAATGQLKNSRAEQEVLMPTFSHATKDGAAVFEFHDESEGTQKLFALAGPLFEIVKRRQVLIVDELDRSLHALLVRHLVDSFQPRSDSMSEAQLIFTTHDTSLLRSDVLRRDQIWFTEKDEKQSSRLFPLIDFAPRKDEALERGYLSGRYGAVPILGSVQEVNNF